MSVGRICCREVDLAAADENVLAAVRRMSERSVGTLVVLNEAKQPIGIVTDRDLLLRVLAAGRDAQTTCIGDVMTREPRVIHEDGPIEAALALMRTGSFRRVPVVTHQGQVVGILSLDDVLDLLAEEFVHIRGILERRRP